VTLENITIVAIAGRLLLVLGFFVLIVIPLELLVARALPDSRLKRFLFDRQLRDREPGTYMAVYAIVVAVMVASVWTYLASR
jgi:hypothetical protein